MSEEYLLYGTAQDSSKSGGVLSVLNLSTSTAVRSFKQNGSFCHRTAVIDSCILAAQADRPIIHAYVTAKEAPVQKIIVPEKLSCLTATHSGAFLAAGTHTGKLILWELGSGACMIYKEIHYGSVTSIVFSADDSVLFSAGSDSRIYSWRLLDLCSSQTNHTDVQPLAAANQHSLEVTELYCGFGGVLDSRLYSISRDNTCKVWSASSLKLYTTYVCQEPLYSIAVDPVERAVYVGGESGTIYHIDMYKSQADGIEYNGGLQRIVEVSPDSSPKFSAHSDKVLSLALSFDATLLVSGSEDGTIVVWDISTHQSLKNIKPGRGPVHSVKTMLKLPAEEYMPLESFQFASEETYTSKHQSWIAIPESEESNCMLSIADTLTSQITYASEPEAAITSEDKEDYKEKFEKLSAAYNSLWKTYIDSLEGTQDG